MMERARPTRFFIPPLKLSGILSFWPSISMTAIIGDELAGTRLVLVEGFGDGGASIIATHNSQLSTCNSQPRTLSGSNCHVALLVSRRINDVEQHREKEIANQNRERGVHYGFSGRTGRADAAGYHQCREHRAKLATDRDRYHCACGRSHADLIKLKERLSREHRAGKRPRDHDNQLGEQSDLDNLVKE